MSGMRLATKFIGLMTMNGKSYCGAKCDGTEFSFELPFWAVHFVFIGCSLPFYFVALRMRVPVFDGVTERKNMKQIFTGLWDFLNSKAVLFLMLASIIHACGGFSNPTGSVLSNVISISTFWSTIGKVLPKAATTADPCIYSFESV